MDTRLMPCRRRPPSQTWRTFLHNHASALVALDFFTVPTITGRVLFVLVVLAHERRRILHVNVTKHPTSAWTRQQLREAFPWEVTPRVLYTIATRSLITPSGVRSRPSA